MKRSNASNSRSTSPDIRRLKRKLNHSSTTEKKPTMKQSAKSISDMKNHDLCDACSGTGQFICCDACPNAFHFTCVEPPMDDIDVANLTGKWYCKECQVRLNKAKKDKSNPRGLLYKLIEDISTKNPKAFSLPNDIVHFFKGVSSDKQGRYVDTTQLKQVRYKNGQVEHPDYCQLKDKSGKFRLCYYCRKTALRKPMIACDYCPLYWHLDCLTLASPPNPAKKWRCPHHIEHILKPPREPRDPSKVMMNKENKIPSSGCRHYLARIIEKELSNTTTLETNVDIKRKRSKEHLITGKNGTVYRLPVNPIQPNFTQYATRIMRNENMRASSIPSTTASSCSSEVNTPPLFNLPMASHKQYPDTTTNTMPNDQEVESWLHTMALFQSGGNISEEQQPEDDEDTLWMSEAQETSLPPSSPLPVNTCSVPPPPPSPIPSHSQPKRTVDLSTYQRYQKFEQLLKASQKL